MQHSEVIELVPLFALDALEADEHRAVMVHLASCDSCQGDLRQYQSIATGFVQDGEAPKNIWHRIQAELDGAESESVKPDSSNVVSIEAGQRPSGTFARWALGAAAAVALVFGGVVVGQNLATSNLVTESGVLAAAEAAAGQPDSFVSDFVVDGVPVAQVVVTSDGLGYVVPTSNLAALSPDRTYQLWVITPDELVISAGVLGYDPAPATFTWTSDIAGFALTREVAGGVVSSAGDVVSVIET